MQWPHLTSPPNGLMGVLRKSVFVQCQLHIARNGLGLAWIVNRKDLSLIHFREIFAPKGRVIKTLRCHQMKHNLKAKLMGVTSQLLDGIMALFYILQAYPVAYRDGHMGYCGIFLDKIKLL